MSIVNASGRIALTRLKTPQQTLFKVQYYSTAKHSTAQCRWISCVWQEEGRLQLPLQPGSGTSSPPTQSTPADCESRCTTNTSSRTTVSREFRHRHPQLWLRRRRAKRCRSTCFDWHQYQQPSQQRVARWESRKKLRIRKSRQKAGIMKSS